MRGKIFLPPLMGREGRAAARVGKSHERTQSAWLKEARLVGNPHPALRATLPKRGGKLMALLLLTLLLLSLPATAAPLGRPVWWKISNGAGATLWILGIPDGLLSTIPWNQDALKHRLDLADAAVMPRLQSPAPERGPCAGVPRAVLTRPGADNDRICGVLWQGSITPRGNIFRDDPLSRRLSPALLARVQKDTPPLAGFDTAWGFNHARTLDVALWLDLWNWPHDKEARLGNAVTLTAFNLAEKAGLHPIPVGRDMLWRPVYASVYPNVTPPEALQVKCLVQVLDETESGLMPARRTAAQQAWANGDLENALRRTGSVHYCLMGDQKSTSAQDYLKNAAYRYITSLDQAFQGPGQTVGVVELDPLLMEDGGVLDHYRRLGYAITTSDGME
ncbi:MAG: TraB/GumN family protein [Caulobacteraceae bacterium]|nr:TraB/GumN family protein [Caulobacteraceae bacterium]